MNFYLFFLFTNFRVEVFWLAMQCIFLEVTEIVLKIIKFCAIMFFYYIAIKFFRFASLRNIFDDYIFIFDEIRITFFGTFTFEFIIYTESCNTFMKFKWVPLHQFMFIRTKLRIIIFIYISMHHLYCVQYLKLRLPSHWYEIWISLYHHRIFTNNLI